ncbi:MAG: hypothetical protein AAF614_36760 [Chloroflexota bacterium]
MIDLTYNKDQMLSDIGLSPERMAVLYQRGNGRSFHTTPEAYFHLTGQTRDDMLPSVEKAFRQRFHTIPPDHLFSDLLVLVKSGLGNAHKRGNLEDPNKTITLEAVATQEGAVVTISDEGDGFDVDSVFARFQRNERYFTNQGKGLQRFVQSRSLVSYSDNGRSLHIRFLCDPVPGQPLTHQDRADFGEAANPAYMFNFFKEAWSPTVKSCRIYSPHKVFGNQRRLLYALRTENGRCLLSGDLLSGEGVRTAVQSTKQLEVDKIAAVTGIQILQPITYLPNPPITFYPFNPQRSLDKIFKKHESLTEETLPLVHQLGAVFQHLHGSQITLPAFVDVETHLETLLAIEEPIVETLEAASEYVPLAKAIFEQLQQQAAQLHDVRPVPSHGNFSWYTVLAEKMQLYLHGLEHCHYSHPGFDIGAFLADLLRHFGGWETEGYVKSERAFLSAYCGQAERPLWLNDLPFFINYALILRLNRLLKRPQKKWKRKVGPLLTQIKTAAPAAV